MRSWLSVPPFAHPSPTHLLHPDSEIRKFRTSVPPVARHYRRVPELVFARSRHQGRSRAAGAKSCPRWLTFSERAAKVTAQLSIMWRKFRIAMEWIGNE